MLEKGNQRKVVKAGDQPAQSSDVKEERVQSVPVHHDGGLNVAKEKTSEFVDALTLAFEESSSARVGRIREECLQKISEVDSKLADDILGLDSYIKKVEECHGEDKDALRGELNQLQKNIDASIEVAANLENKIAELDKKFSNIKIKSSVVFDE